MTIRVQIQFAAIQLPFCHGRNKRALLECGCPVFGRTLASVSPVMKVRVQAQFTAIQRPFCHGRNKNGRC